MLPLTNEKSVFIVGKTYVIYVKKDLVLMITITNIIKSKVIFITLHNLVMVNHCHNLVMVNQLNKK